MTNSVSIFSADNTAITYHNKKGDAFNISTEGALFKGGQAIAALKDAAMLSAYHKAEAGRYRAASDIVSAAFPSMAKAFEKFIGVEPWSSKTTMSLFLDKVEAMRPTNEVKGFTKKQNDAKLFINQLRSIKALARAEDNAFVVEA
jgi:hypothetical protein